MTLTPRGRYLRTLLIDVTFLMLVFGTVAVVLTVAFNIGQDCKTARQASTP